MKLESAFAESGVACGNKLSAEDTAEYFDGKKEGLARRDPAIMIRCGISKLVGSPLDYYKALDPKTGNFVGFPTPSSRIEIFSVIVRQHGFDPLPDYAELADSPYSRPESASRFPGVVSAPHGWWQGCRELGLPGYGWDGANANILVPGDAHDQALGVPALRSQLCRIYKAEEPP